MRLPGTVIRNTVRTICYKLACPSVTPNSTIRLPRTSTMSTQQMIQQMTPMRTDLERLSDRTRLSAHVTRVLGRNPGLMTLQGTNSYLLQPPSNGLAPLILIDTSSPHTAQQYVDCLMTHLFHLGLESGNRETHFESAYADQSFENIPEEEREKVKAQLIGSRLENPAGTDELQLTEYGSYGRWTKNTTRPTRKLPNIEHIILTHRHLDHVGALPLLLTTLKEHGMAPPKLWKFPSPDEAELAMSERDRLTTDAALIQALPQGTYQAFSPFQPIHPVMPGLMISIIDPAYKHLLKHDKDGKPKWNEVPEIARVSVRCLRTPGHTADSISLFMCEGEKGVFTGDTVLGQGTTIFTDLASYMTSLKTTLALKPSVMYPAHGPHIAGSEKVAGHINEYLKHRQDREDQILALLKALADRPAMLGEAMSDLMKKVAEEKKAEIKYNNEFISGKPYNPKPKVDEKDEADVKDGKKKAGNEDGGDKADVDAENKDNKADEVAAATALAYDVDLVKSKFSVNETGITIPLMCRLLYKTDKEGLIFAASKSILAHLVKLEGEGKVRRVTVTMPRIYEGQISDEPEATEGWEWAGEDTDVEISEKLKLE